MIGEQPIGTKHFHEKTSSQKYKNKKERILYKIMLVVVTTQTPMP
jgi:hypothetical protein